MHEGPHNLYASSDIIMVIKPRRITWVVHVTHMGEISWITWKEKATWGHALDSAGSR